jgi:hypothetical protein
MKLYIAFDRAGRIIAAGEAGPDGGDRPDEQPGLTVAEMDLPEDVTAEGVEEFLGSSVVDVQAQSLQRVGKTS